MKHFRMFSFTILTLTLFTACRAEKAVEQGQQTNSATATATAGDTMEETAPVARREQVNTTDVSAAGSVIKVDFHGAISHIIGQSSPRAVLIKDEHHHSRLEILRPTQIASNAATSQTALQAAVGDPASNLATCGAGTCEVKPLDGLIMRLVDDAGVPVTGPLTLGPDFELFVPALKTAAHVIVPDANLSASAPAGDFTAFFDLTGGELSARPYCTPVPLNLDHENRGPRDFAETVTLTATTGTPAGLQFSNDGSTWRTLKFLRATSLVMRVVNDPDVAHQTMNHFEIHKKVAADESAVVDYPLLANVIDNCRASLAVGCGNTRWP